MSALRVLHGTSSDGSAQPVPVLMISAQTGQGLPELWSAIGEHQATMKQSGRLEQRRRDQLLRWMWSMVEDRVLHALRTHPEVGRLARGLEADVLAGTLTPTLGARALLEAFGVEP
jgi:LAO/AO transport system kinase